MHDGIHKEKCCPVKDCNFTTYHNKDLNRHIRKHTGMQADLLMLISSLRIIRINIILIYILIAITIHFLYFSLLCQEIMSLVSWLSHRMPLMNCPGEKPFQCEECGTSFSRGDKLKVHARIHSNVRPYWCDVAGCQYRAIDSGSLRKHKRTHTNERPYR